MANEPFRNDERVIAEADATLREAEEQARVVRRQPWLAFGGAYLAVALTIALFVLVAFLASR